MGVLATRARGGTRIRLFTGVFATLLMVSFGGIAGAVSGNIHPAIIEHDANVYPGGSAADCTPLETGSDWVADCAANTDTATLQDSIATGLIAGLTSKAGGTGHWKGVRIVDGIAGDDQDIFLTGGKENDTATWNVGPGSVGSAKYDATQAYLANNQSTLYFGMERRGNNGTTAFQFEFNQEPPSASTPYIPTRTQNDKLFVFLMSGSGSSGSATPLTYSWDATNSEWDSFSLPSIKATINENTTTPAPPWGHVDTHDGWTGGNYNRFEFAEAEALISQAFPDFTGCANTAYVQIRTRSAIRDGSDLKDTTKIFPFVFGQPEAAATLATDCTATFTYNGAGSKNSTGSVGGVTYDWDIDVSPATATLSGGGVSVVDATAGEYTSTSESGTVTVTFPTGVNAVDVTLTNTVSEGGCTDDSNTLTVTVYRLLDATATLTPQCDNRIGYSGAASGGLAPYTFSWQLQVHSVVGGVDTWTNVGSPVTGASGTFTPGVAGRYRAILTVTDTAGTSNQTGVTPKPQCTKQVTSNVVNVYDAVDAAVSLTPDCDDTFTYSALGTGGKAPYSYAFTLQKLVAGTWTTATTFNATDTVGTPGVGGTLDVDDATWLVGGDGRYRLRVTITDSQSIVCTDNATSNEVDIKHALTATASKQSASGSALSVTMTSTFPSDATVQWQRQTGPTTWVNISGANAASLVYDSFESHDTPELTSFTIATGAAAGSYEGKVWEVTLRVHVTRTINGILCEADSNAVTITKVTGVDP